MKLKKEGAALLLELTPNFYRLEDNEKGKLKFVYLLGYLRPYRKYILQLGLGMLTVSIISLVFPFLTQAKFDYGIGNSDLSFIVMVLVTQMVLTFGHTTKGLIRSWIMLHVTTAFFKRNFPNPAFIFNTPNPEHISISGWWRKQDKNEVQKILNVTVNHFFYKILKLHFIVVVKILFLNQTD